MSETTEHGPARRLVEDALLLPDWVVDDEGESVATLRAAADALDAQPRWPHGEQAARELADAWRATLLYDKSLSVEEHCAAVLARLNTESEGNDGDAV